MPSTSRRRRAGAGRQQPAPKREAGRPDRAPEAKRPPAPVAPVQAPAGGASASRHRLLAGAALILAPAAFLGGQLALLPVAGPGSGLGAITQQLGAWRTAYALLLASSVLTVPMVLAIDHLLRRRAPLWADAGSALAIVGTLAAVGIALVGFVVAEMAATGGGEQLEALLDRLRPLFTAMDMVEDLLLLGMVGLALGLYRYRAAPAAAVGLLLASLALSWGPSGLRVAAAALALAGLGWIGVTVLRWPDEAWLDPPAFPPMPRPVVFATVMTLLFVVGVGSVARFLALVAVFIALVVYRPVASGLAEGGTDAGHPS